MSSSLSDYFKKERLEERKNKKLMCDPKVLSKKKVSKLPGGSGFVIRKGSINVMFLQPPKIWLTPSLQNLNKKKIRVSYPKGLPLSKVIKFVDRAFQYLAARMITRKEGIRLARLID